MIMFPLMTPWIWLQVVTAFHVPPYIHMPSESKQGSRRSPARSGLTGGPKSAPPPSMGGASPSAHEATISTKDARVVDGRVPSLRLSSSGGRERARYELRCGVFSRVGLSFTTTQVTPAASAITQMMKTTRPISPRTVSMPDLE